MMFTKRRRLDADSKKAKYQKFAKAEDLTNISIICTSLYY